MTLTFKTKQRTIIAVLLTLLSLLVVGCGGSSESPAPDESTTTDLEGPAFVLFYTDN